ncbi:MAG: type II restriction endonuclease [Chloroflexi bacterium]|nr:type II restriction endonuclease [Chloroflexota bacterium]
MSLEPQSLLHNLTLLEQVEKATLRMVVQAIYDFRNEAGEFFIHETDLVADIGEDITREAMDRMGTSTIPVRLFGKIDYKRARYVFQPEYSVRQALFVDSKAEKIEGAGTVTIQTAQTSMSVRQMRAGAPVDEQGTLPRILNVQNDEYLVTTVFVKYNYSEGSETLQKALESMSVTCLPNGILQDRYNPTPEQTFWLAGRNAPSRGEPFRARISLSRLKQLASWRVQHISLDAGTPFVWDE